MADTVRRIAINTGGGDAPGLNAVIHGAVHAAANLGWEVSGILDGYDGLLHPGRYPGGGVVPLDRAAVANIQTLGGTILGTSNRGNPFRSLEAGPDGTVVEVDRSGDVLRAFAERGFDALIAVGGDGSLSIALDLHRKGLRVVGVPKTIDNDLMGTQTTFGFQSAVSFAAECLDRLHATARSHRRILVVEVMGRNAGWIALYAGVAGNADAILIPEIPYDIGKVAAHMARRTGGGKSHGIVVVAEGAKPVGGEATVRSREPGRAERLGGIGEVVAAQLSEVTGQETRAVVLGHLLRGGSPIAFDRLLGLGFGAAAVYGLRKGLDGVMVILNTPRLEFVPLEDAVRRQKTVPPDSDVLLVARTLGIAFGD